MSEGIIISPSFFVYFATITVTYPAGSTLTCTCGSDSFTAETTSGSYTFVVPYAGTWTVTATNGIQTKSANVSIITYNQATSVTLSYELILFDNGINKELWGGTINQRNITVPNVSYEISNTLFLENSGNWDYSVTVDITTNSPVDFSPYKTLYVTVYGTQPIVDYGLYVFHEIRVGTTKFGYNSARRTGVFNQNALNYAIDVSNVWGNQYVDLYQRVTEPFSGGPARMRVTKVWLA